MKNSNLLVPVKRACQTTKSLQGEKPWRNRLENLQVSRQDQVWVADITYVRLKGRFNHGCFHSDDQSVASESAFDPISDALEEAWCHSVPEIHHSDQGVQYLSYIATLQEHRIFSQNML